MATLTEDEVRTLELGEFNDLPVIADEIIHEGAAIGDNGIGYMRPLVAEDPFMGFCARKIDNDGGIAGAEKVHLRGRGKIILVVVGVTGVGDVRETVYATDDNTFTLNSSGASSIGKITRWISSTKCVVYFEGVQLRSL